MTYEIVGTKKKVNQLDALKEIRKDVEDKLRRLTEDPRRESGAHMLKGRLHGLWSCWLTSKIRMIYEIDDEQALIKIVTIGGHEVYD